jgi:NADPH:quinone reductase-like Zn-dependent oxidoreductase
MSVTSGTESLEPLITLDGLTISPILDGETQMDANLARELCYKLKWDPILEPLQTIPNGISNGVEKRGEIPSNVEIVIIHEESSFQQLVALGVANALEQVTGRLPEVGNLSEVNVAGKLVVFIPELHHPLLSNLSSDQFTSLQKMLTTVEGVLWVVRGAYTRSASPEANMVTGFSRTIRSETALKFATLDLDAECPLSESDTTDAIVKVLTAIFGYGSVMSELEFVERGGAFFTPRIVHDTEMNEFVHKRTNPAVLEPSSFSEDDRLLKMDITTPGALGTLHFIDDNASEAPLAADEVEIEVKAIGLNYKDAMAAKGQIPISECGVEASGVVLAVGSEVSTLQVGDRVAALTKGAFATRTRTSVEAAFKVSPDMSFESAASLPLAYCTAYYSLVELGRISEGETVLVHAAAGSVGQAAICIAQMIGAEVYATVSSAEKKELLVAQYGLSPDRIFYSRNTSFAAAVRTATKGQGVDIVLNSLTGDALRASWECLSKFGRFLEIGKREQAIKTRVEMAHIDNNASLINVDLLAVAAGRPKVMKRLVAEVGKLMADGKARAITPIATFPISDVETAFKALQAGTQGKLVVVPSPNDVVIVRTFSPVCERRVLG